ncbi:MAG: hypothetical protein H8D77_01465 [Chloroflexi bacterium]|jgi:hypothetical protein|nr:hypothetical protein [Chloroflexota bacterium]
MITGKDVLYAAEVRRDRMAFAEQERLIRPVRRGGSLFFMHYRRWLARLGAQLIAWGDQLQTRYTSAFDHP